MVPKRKLIGFGDSWAQGSELLPDQESFSQLLSKQLGCIEYLNYSRAGSSVNHLLVQLQSFLSKMSATHQDPSEWTAIFFLTDQHRGSAFHDNQWLFQNPAGGVGEVETDRQLVDQVNAAYWKYIHSPELSSLTANSTILALQSICQTHSIDDYYITGWQAFDLWREVDVEKFYQYGQASCGDLIGMQLDIPGSYVNQQNPNQAPGGHPNQSGHILIADALYEWITESCATRKN